MRDRLIRWAPALAVAAATLVVGRDWWHTWLLAGHSAYMDFFRQLVLDAAVRQGDLWPRFAEDFYFGHGSLLFHFYAPLSYWITEIFLLLGASVSVGIKLTLALTVFLSGLFAAFLARDLFGPWAGAAAGTFFVMAPYHLTDALARHAFGETVAFAWLPLALWGVLGAVRDRSRLHMIAGALGTAFLLLTHNITALIAAPLLLAWWIFLTVRHRADGWRGPVLGASAGAGGALLAAFFWLPAFLETDLVKSHASLTQGYFVYGDHFVYLKQFFLPAWGHGGSRAGLDDTMSYQLGLAHWFGLAAVLPVWLMAKQWRAPLAFFGGTLVVSLAMCHFVSQPIWRLVPVLAFAQFPWRFLLVASLAASVAVAPVAQWLADRWKNGVGVGLALCFILLPLVVYFPYTYSRHVLYDTQRDKFRAYGADQYRARVGKERFQRPEQFFDADAIRNRLVRATARDDFLPRDVKLLPDGPSRWDVNVKRGSVWGVQRRGPRHYVADVNLTHPGTVTLARFFYPGWRATIDGKPAPVTATSPRGLVAVEAPEGRHEIEFEFGPTPLRIAAWLISLLGLAGLATVCFVFRPKK